MAETLSQPESLTPRHIVSYFDHEFAERPALEQAVRDIEEMKASGFTTIVLCVTEADVADSDRQRYLHDVVAYASERGMQVWADPWSVGGIFGGEGGSVYRSNGETRCYCNPHVDALLQEWLTTVKKLGIATAFWDEPEMHCDVHRHDDAAFLAVYTGHAESLGLQNVVCMCANEANVDMIETVANLPSVAEIATDPYFPNAFTRIGESDRLAYVERWARRTRAIGMAAGKRSHVWVQGFGIPEGRESMVAEHVSLVRSLHVADVALWGFGGCRSVPNFSPAGYAAPDIVWAAAKEAFAASAI